MRFFFNPEIDEQMTDEVAERMIAEQGLEFTAYGFGAEWPENVDEIVDALNAYMVENRIVTSEGKAALWELFCAGSVPGIPAPVWSE